jgi:hypothetical protein
VGSLDIVPSGQERRTTAGFSVTGKGASRRWSGPMRTPTSIRSLSDATS